MSATIPQSHVDLLTEPVFVTLATVMPDGQPQCSVVWCDYDGEDVLINTAQKRQKARNMRNDPQVTVLAIDPENPYRYLEVRGTVEDMVKEGALDHINKLAKQYVGASSYYGDVAPAEQQDEETRVMCKIRPTRVRAYGD
jgi:PPOX class probable F420-dependent enzyme